MEDKIKGTVNFIAFLLGGFLSVAAAINSMVYTPLNTAIASERTDREAAICSEAKDRCEADNKSFSKLDSKLDKIMEVQAQQGKDIAVIKQKVDLEMSFMCE